VAERRRWAAWYEDRLTPLDWLRTPAVPEGYDHSWQSFVTVIDEGADVNRDRLMDWLHDDHMIEVRPGTHTVPALGWYRKHLGTSADDVPVAAMLARQSMAIPLHNQMTEGDFERVAQALEAF
jgi:dTDP-4-amino-4,6-dideoxygalactose transaminase